MPMSPAIDLPSYTVVEQVGVVDDDSFEHPVELFFVDAV